ncbi:hypothetical protein BpHYR1_045535 [Brachionus plicatilis]|uniref:Uncharacterized protein n=1 Tax=Brachionus plicatilis TaxID=10195 RepID=A0A3M7SD53_BRAPC|nr:hypothetical protein BpHYR1_045535 [Brachionus plicatilis]
MKNLNFFTKLITDLLTYYIACDTSRHSTLSLNNNRIDRDLNSFNMENLKIKNLDIEWFKTDVIIKNIIIFAFRLKNPSQFLLNFPCVAQCATIGDLLVDCLRKLTCRSVERIIHCYIYRHQKYTIKSGQKFFLVSLTQRKDKEKINSKIYP